MSPWVIHSVPEAQRSESRLSLQRFAGVMGGPWDTGGVEVGGTLLH